VVTQPPAPHTKRKTAPAVQVGLVGSPYSRADLRGRVGQGTIEHQAGYQDKGESFIASSPT